MANLYGERSVSLDLWFAAMAQFQGSMDEVHKNATGEFGQYLDLAGMWSAIRQPLAAAGLCATQPLVPYGDDGTLALMTMVGHKSGQFMCSIVPLAPSAPQVLAADTTYLSRICLGKLLGIAGADHDDDGTQAQENHIRFANPRQEKFFNLAKAALAKSQVAERDDLHERVEAHVTEGRLTPAIQKQLLEEFPTQSRLDLNARNRLKEELAATTTKQKAVANVD